jgi:hypothetical protein
MRDAKMTVFTAYPFESVEMTLSYLNHRDIGGKQNAHICTSPPIYKGFTSLVRHPSTINALDAQQPHSHITNPT